MSARLLDLALRKETLVTRAEMERLVLAQNLANLRRPAQVSYQGLKLVSLLRSPLAGLLAASLGKHFGGGTATGSTLKTALRYVGYVFAGWRAMRVLREIIGSRRLAES